MKYHYYDTASYNIITWYYILLPCIISYYHVISYYVTTLQHYSSRASLCQIIQLYLISWSATLLNKQKSKAFLFSYCLCLRKFLYSRKVILLSDFSDFKTTIIKMKMYSLLWLAFSNFFFLLLKIIVPNPKIPIFLGF